MTKRTCSDLVKGTLEFFPTGKQKCHYVLIQTLFPLENSQQGYPQERMFFLRFRARMTAISLRECVSVHPGFGHPLYGHPLVFPEQRYWYVLCWIGQHRWYMAKSRRSFLEVRESSPRLLLKKLNLACVMLLNSARRSESLV